MAHTNHGDIHEIGLQDNCLDCESHAQFPWRSLDNEMLKELIARNFKYRFGGSKLLVRTNEPRSETEAYAMTQITNVMERTGKLFEASPTFMVRYLNEKWGTKLELDA